MATIQKGRSGEEKRKIESGGEKTTFEIEFQLIEEEQPKSANIQFDLPNIEGSKKG